MKRHLPESGKYFLDAGSGPIQYPEYMTYSQGFQYRVCVDLSLVALKAARKRIGSHGLFVIGDVAELPFRSGSFEGLVSLHTLHHLPVGMWKRAFSGFDRVLRANGNAVVVNGWGYSQLMHSINWLIILTERIIGWLQLTNDSESEGLSFKEEENNEEQGEVVRTFVEKMTAKKFMQEIGMRYPIQVVVWRSVHVRFLRALIHPKLAGQFWLKILYWMEEQFPRWFGENGAYPLIVLNKRA